MKNEIVILKNDQLATSIAGSNSPLSGLIAPNLSLSGHPSLILLPFLISDPDLEA